MTYVVVNKMLAVVFLVTVKLLVTVVSWFSVVDNGSLMMNGYRCVVDGFVAMGVIMSVAMSESILMSIRNLVPMTFVTMRTSMVPVRTFVAMRNFMMDDRLRGVGVTVIMSMVSVLGVDRSHSKCEDDLNKRESINITALLSYNLSNYLHFQASLIIIKLF